MIDSPPFAIEYAIPLTGGLSDRNRLISAQGEKYVLHDIESECELYMMVHAAKLGVAPKVLRENGSQVVMEYIEEPTITPEVAREHPREIGAALRRAHSIPLFSEKGVSIEEANRIRYEYLRSHFEKMPALLEEATKVMEKFEELASIQSPLKVNIHMDLHPRNLFWTEKQGFLIIDWEGSAHGHPYFDLASLPILLALNDEQERELVEGYLGRPPTLEEWREYAHFKKIRWAYTSIVNYLWASRLLEGGHEPPNPDVGPEHPWAYYMESFAASEGMPPLQFFVDVARISANPALFEERLGKGD